MFVIKYEKLLERAMPALIASAALVTALVIPGVGFAADPDPAD